MITWIGSIVINNKGIEYITKMKHRSPRTRFVSKCGNIPEAPT